jgi:hypothetical protein
MIAFIGGEEVAFESLGTCISYLDIHYDDAAEEKHTRSQKSTSVPKSSSFSFELFTAAITSSVGYRIMPCTKNRV